MGWYPLDANSHILSLYVPVYFFIYPIFFLSCAWFALSFNFGNIQMYWLVQFLILDSYILKFLVVFKGAK